MDNKKRFLEATRCIYDKYAAYLHTPNDSQDLIAAIGEAIGDYDGDEEDRIARYKTLIGDEYIEYDDRQWFNNAVDFTTKEAPYSGGDENITRSETAWVWRGDYKNSHWYKFQEAVKAHQDREVGTFLNK